MVSSSISQSKFSLDALKVQDYIKFQEDPQLMALISGEKLLFADMIKKINMFGWSQERVFVITHKGIFNIYKKSIKRNILIS